MKKQLLSFLALVLLSFSTFSQTQTQIWTAQEFIESVGTGGNYIQMADIDLGDRGEISSAIKSSFSGTYDGNGHTITYQAQFNVSGQNSYGLFGSVSGTIKNLTVNASATLSGTANHTDVGLFCGKLGSEGLLESCNVMGNLNSTASESNNGAGTDTGLLVGESAGTIKYCIGSGNVTGIGHVGGLVGRMNGGLIRGSAFYGSVYALSPSKTPGNHSYGSVAGGICGAVQAGSTIELCFVDADIVSEDINSNNVDVFTYGIAYDHNNGVTIKNNYCEGTVNGQPIDAGSDITNNNGNYNYFPGGSTNPNNSTMSSEEIAATLNDSVSAAGESGKIHFSPVGASNVIFGGGSQSDEGNNELEGEITEYITAKTGIFASADTWQNGKVPTGNAGTITIQQGHIVTLTHTLTLSGNCTIINNGVLVINHGELINTTSNNVGGIVELSTAITESDRWAFIGAPFENYKLETIKPVSGSDISVSLYDYDSTKWDYEWALYDSQVGKGEGYFAWPFYSGAVSYTTYGDLFVWNAEGTNGTIMTSYDFSKPAKYKLNNAEFTITKNVQGNTNTGRWMALANPYPAKLSISKFVTANNIQGQGIYRLTNRDTTVNGKVVQAYDYVITQGDIAMTEGFFVNLASGSSVTFKKEQLTNYPTTQSKSQVAPREFVELSLVKGNHKSKLYFAHNQEAEQGYDIFDANKLFAIGEVAEPYFVTDGIALVKEEVAELPYYATMNVRSFANDTISFVVENIPEGISVFLIDNEEEIKMCENIGYTTVITEGENADRFQVLFKKASIIEDAKDSDITITNSNRLVNVASEQTDLQVEVYNALGQKVFATNDYNFTLNEVSAGAYMVKAFNNRTTQTTKIIIQ
ncbi:MAG: T9SS type A sorting domain-containing protein [Bacteroidales bacterium]|nr:T9SS type A sorting domain-containing protein [Bacteroidales bacterium]